MEEPLSERILPHPSRLSHAHSDYSAIVEAHAVADGKGEDGYLDPVTGLFVFTAGHHLRRGQCCDTGCRHCPYLDPAQ